MSERLFWLVEGKRNCCWSSFLEFGSGPLAPVEAAVWLWVLVTIAGGVIGPGRMGDGDGEGPEAAFGVVPATFCLTLWSTLDPVQILFLGLLYRVLLSN